MLEVVYGAVMGISKEDETLVRAVKANGPASIVKMIARLVKASCAESAQSWLIEQVVGVMLVVGRYVLT